MSKFWSLFFFSFISLPCTTWAFGSKKPSNPSAPSSSGSKVVTSTIVITKSGTYDFKKVLHIWKGKKWNCTGDKEHGPQILRIEADNVTIRNFHFIGDGSSRGSYGLGDPIHITSCGTGQGNQCSRRGPQNVVLDGVVGHACEDFLTIGTPGSRNIAIKNSYIKANPKESAWDKSVQINFGENILFQNNTFVGGHSCIRFKPQTSGEVIGNKFYDCSNAVTASSNDADIEPMRNGPTRVQMRDNKFYSVDNQVKKIGSEVYIDQ